MKCNNCNHENNVNAKFCSSCGKALTNEKKKINKVALVILSLVVLYLLTFFVYPYFFPKELYKIKVGDKYGFIDNKGNMVIKPRFDDAEDFSEGMAEIEVYNKDGYVNKRGKIIFPENDKIYSLSEFKNGRAKFSINNNGTMYGFLDKNGGIAIKPIFESIEKFSEKRARFYENNKYGFIDTDGDVIIKPTYYSATNFKEGFALVKKTYESGYDFINKKGRTIKSNIYSAYEFNEGLALIKKDEKSKFGFIDEDGNWAISAKFYSANSFVNGVAKVKKNKDDDYIYIDLDGIEIEK